MADNFERDLKKEFDRVIGTIEKGVAEEIKNGLQKAIELSPVQTGYMASNFRIGVDGENVPLDPPVRPKPGGAVLVPDVQGEEAKLKDYKLTETDITIGNSVPYSLFIDSGTSRIPAANIMERTADSISARIEKRFK